MSDNKRGIISKNAINGNKLFVYDSSRQRSIFNDTFLNKNETNFITVANSADLTFNNPINSIHDQGAGGNSNVLKEIAEPAGCRLELRDILIGDNSLSVLEIWGSEYQENNALLIQPESLDVFSKIATRENCPFAVLGVVTGDGRVVLHDSNDDSTPVNLELDKILGSLPQKTFVDTTKAKTAKPVDFSGDILFVGKNKRAKSMSEQMIEA